MVKRNPKYDTPSAPTIGTDRVFKTKDVPPEFREDLTSEIKSVIGEWIKDSTPINTALRYGKTHEYFIGDPALFEKAITGAGLLSEAINQSSLQQEYVVARGLGPYDVQRIKEAFDERNKTGVSVLIRDDGFTAVSFQESIAYEYAIPVDNGEKFLLVSKLHRGEQALFIGNENPSFERKEGEILLQKNTGYYITGKRTIITDQNEIVHLIEVAFVGIR